MKVKESVKKLILAAVIVLIGLAVVLGIFEAGVKSKIKEDIDEKLQYVEAGDLSWTPFSTVDISNELKQYISDTDSSEDGVFRFFIRNNDITYKVGMALWNTCTVKFYCQGYSFEEYLHYCEKNKIDSYDDMRDCLDAFAQAVDKNYTAVFSMKYEKIDGTWVCDYNKVDFLNNVSCGIVNSYGDYYENSIQGIQNYIENAGLDMQQEDGEDE